MADGEDAMPQRRMVMIGARRDGKSSTANTILRKQRFECGRIPTVQSEALHEIVEGRELVVVDAPGWKNSPSLSEIPEREKEQFKINASKCPPGPHAFLLVIPIDARFSYEQKMTVEDYMKLLGDRVWQHTIVLFTFGDFLGSKTIEQYIESEGEALTWLIEKCQDRYHVINNKDKSNLTQVTELIEKIDEMVEANDNGFYRLDMHAFDTIMKKQEEIAKRAYERHRQALETRRQMKAIVSGMEPIKKLQMILLGSRFVGKTSLVGSTEITIVDTPGWRKGFTASDTPEMIKDEVLYSLFKCQPGPHVFLLVIDAEASFNRNHLNAATTHMELLGKGVWKHTILVFTRGDCLRSRNIEEYIEGEGKALQSLVERCGDRYHVIDNMNADDGSQIKELLEKITLTLAGNKGQHFKPNRKMLEDLKEKEKKVEEAVLQRSQAKAAKVEKGFAKKLNELQILIIGEKLSGKTTAANYILQSMVFHTKSNHGCMAQTAQVAGRRVTVVDTPGWNKVPECTSNLDREIVQGLTLSHEGVHAVLIMISLDMTFNDVNKEMLEDHVNLFGESVWDHTIVLFTNMESFTDRSLEDHIVREHLLQWLIEKCRNRYHYLNVTEKSNVSQHQQLFTKIEEMSAKNQGRLFHPDINDIHLRIDKKFHKRQIKDVLQHVIEQGSKIRELELCKSFKEKLIKLQGDINEIVPAPRTLGAGFKGKGKKKCVLADIEQEIDDLNKTIFQLSQRNSMDFGNPSLSGSTQTIDEVAEWLSTIETSTSQASMLTLNSSQSSGYRSQYLPLLDD
ncbi:uncharacterized protein LOC130918712 isoform X2 [Corythoichthys intestinalis]|uniref:uncharacterized protein LOC130918712 isoform X2 n=1 Tax=Corythoichthys intestinalis TaxID=161448 RepID=UPI0025A4D334|nr:uncharacterized protein LOC130918712 isoform X2 [Corythoichthys intestinalis]